MLVELATGKTVQPLPGKDFTFQFNQISAAMPPADLAAARAHVDHLIASTGQAKNGGHYAVASWLPGSHWGGTPLAPIYSTTVRIYPGATTVDHHRLSARFFGVLVKQAMCAHPDTWARYFDEDLADSWIYVKQ